MLPPLYNVQWECDEKGIKIANIEIEKTLENTWHNAITSNFHNTDIQVECKWRANGQTNHNDNRTIYICSGYETISIEFVDANELFLVSVQCAWQTVILRTHHRISYAMENCDVIENFIRFWNWYTANFFSLIRNTDRTLTLIWTRRTNDTLTFETTKMEFLIYIHWTEILSTFTEMGVHSHNFSCIFLAVPPFFYYKQMWRDVFVSPTLLCFFLALSSFSSL